jgi:hypothetical protein
MFGRSTPAPEAEESKDIFAPVADLMVSVVFIFIVLMLALVMNLQREEVVPRSLYDAEVARVRGLEAQVADLTKGLEEETQLRAAAEARGRELALTNERLLDFAEFVRASDLLPRLW